MLQLMTEQEVEDFEDYLADVLMVWDCYEQCWVDDAPIILRFENADVAIAQTEESGNYGVSHLETGGSKLLLDSISDKADPEGTCLCWRRIRIEAFPLGVPTKLSSVYKLMLAKKPHCRT